jgi:sugar transferase (PEP-CTERM/EpsH1 system associated)
MIAPVGPHVVQVVHRLDVGGLENGVVNIVNRIPAERYRCTIVCLAGYSREFRARIQRSDVDVVSLDKKPGKDLPMYGRMWRLLRRLRPAIVHTRNLGTIDMQWVAAAAGVQGRVHGEHGWEASDPLGRNSKSLAIRRACRPVIHRYVPMSKDIARWLERDVGVPAARIRQTYNGVDTSRFTPEGAGPMDLPWASLSSDRALVVGTVGRLDPVKDQAALLRAVRLVRDRRPGLRETLRLLVVGDGPERARLERLATELGLADVAWLAGRRQDTPELMRLIDVFALPSLNEGISNTILEAMATALPVVATRVGGNPELVVHGVTGTLVEPGSDEALGDALTAYLDDPGLRRRHGTAARARAAQQFSIDAMVDGYLSVYDEVLAATRQAAGIPHTAR